MHGLVSRDVECVYACRRGKRKPVPFATVVTDLTTCHNTWFHPLVDRCFVPTLYCKRSAMKNGLKEEQVRPDARIGTPGTSQGLSCVCVTVTMSDAFYENRQHLQTEMLAVNFSVCAEAFQLCRSLCMVCPSGLHSAGILPPNSNFARDLAWIRSCPLSCLLVSAPLHFSVLFIVSVTLRQSLGLCMRA